MSTISPFLAHVRTIEDGSFVVHELDDHLISVASMAGEFARDFGNQDWAYAAGLWHDLGKYSADFQRRIKHHSGYDPTAHLEGPTGKVNHSTAGAIHAIKQLGVRGNILAYIIAGHHAGLADWESAEAGNSALAQRLRQTELYDIALQASPPDNILNTDAPVTRPPTGADPAFWIRLLFSCVVDADFLDTERFMDRDKHEKRSRYPQLQELSAEFDKHMDRLKTNCIPTPVNKMRADILAQCKEKAPQPPGLFSLTVPTGGGKTLSSLAFALKHAQAHNKHRIIYVIPYTSIIEQTADIFKEIFGDGVIEHHSNLDPENETIESRLACENWDAPIVVTTTVQFFESLFAARTSKARKIHNIINSVVILDEAQLLPPNYLCPILQAIKELHTNYGVSFVLSTATQPALTLAAGTDLPCRGLSDAHEIIDDPAGLHEKLKRVAVTIPKDLTAKKNWEEIAAELQTYDRVLCIVNRRDDCRDLYRLMPPGTVSLSGLMCGEHRSRVISIIKSRLREGTTLRVISTQLVECGVDLDFPVVYRALSGLDSIAQAGGRCNREGNMTAGKLVVFVPPKSSPKGHLRQAEDTCRQVLQTLEGDPLTPTSFNQYFNQLFWKKGEDLDRHKILQTLKADNELRIKFRTAAHDFKIIDESQQAPVIVLYGESPILIQQLRKHGPERWLMRKLQRYIVNIPKYIYKKLQQQAEIVDVHSGIYAQAFEGLYHPEMGLLASDPTYHEPDSLIV